MLTTLATAEPGVLAAIQYPEPPQLKAAIPVANAMYSPSGMHVTFVLHLTDQSNDLTWHCTHRYSSFRALHSSIGKHFVGSKWFPSLLFTNKANRNKQEIDQRRRKLEIYMGMMLDAIFAVRQQPGTGKGSNGSNAAAGVPFHRVAKVLQFLEYPFVDQWDDILKLSVQSESQSAPASIASLNSSSSTIQSANASGSSVPWGGSFGNINGNPPVAGGSSLSSNAVGGLVSSGDRYTPREGGVNGQSSEGWEEDPSVQSWSGTGADSVDDISGMSEGGYISSQCNMTNITGKSSADRANPPDHQPITSIRSQWRRPYKLPGPNLGLSLPFASLVLSIDAEWEVNVRGDKVLPEVKTVQDFIAGFRRRHPLSSYLRMDSLVAESARVSQRSSHLSDEPGTHLLSSDSSSDAAIGNGSAAERAVVEEALYVAERGRTMSEYSDDEEDDGTLSVVSSTQSHLSNGGARRASDGTLGVRRTGSRGSPIPQKRRSLAKEPNSKHYNLQGNLPLPALPSNLINTTTIANSDVAPLKAEELPPQAIPINSIDALITQFHQNSHNSLFFDASLAPQAGSPPKTDPRNDIGSPFTPQPRSEWMSPDPSTALFLSGTSNSGNSADVDGQPRLAAQHFRDPEVALHEESSGDLLSGSGAGATSGDRTTSLEGGIFSPKPHHETRRSLEPHFPSSPPAMMLGVPGRGGIQTTPTVGTPPRTSAFSPHKVASSPGAMTHLDQIKGESVYGCRCSRRHFCVSAEATGDIYVTKSNQALVVVPPPFPEQLEERDTGRYVHPLQDMRNERLRRHYQAKIVSGAASAVLANSGPSSANATPKKKKKPPVLVVSTVFPAGLTTPTKTTEDEELEASLLSPSIVRQQNKDSCSQDSFSSALAMAKPEPTPVSTPGGSSQIGGDEEGVTTEEGSARPVTGEGDFPEEPSSLSTVNTLISFQQRSQENNGPTIVSPTQKLPAIGVRGSVVEGEEEEE